MMTEADLKRIYGPRKQREATPLWRDLLSAAAGGALASAMVCGALIIIRRGRGAGTLAGIVLVAVLAACVAKWIR
jgi:hypothetical protein